MYYSDQSGDILAEQRLFEKARAMGYGVFDAIHIARNAYAVPGYVPSLHAKAVEPSVPKKPVARQEPVIDVPGVDYFGGESTFFL